MPAYSQIHHELIKYKLKANADSLPRYQKKKKFLHLLVPCYMEWTHKCQKSFFSKRCTHRFFRKILSFFFFCYLKTQVISYRWQFPDCRLHVASYTLQVAAYRLLKRPKDWAYICFPKVVELATAIFSKAVKVIYVTTVTYLKLVKWLKKWLVENY